MWHTLVCGLQSTALSLYCQATSAHSLHMLMTRTILFVCSSFNDAVSSLYYRTLNDIMMVDKLERMWTDVVIAYLKMLHQHLPGGLRKTTRNRGQNSRSLGRDLRQRPPEAGVLTT
jgi:hypothetical protein